MRRPAEPRAIQRVGSLDAGPRDDSVAVEAPLTLSSQGDVWLTTMRTPGDDRDLLVGWLYHEGLVREPRAEISSLSVCGRPGDASYGDAYELVPNAAMEARLKTRDPAAFSRTELTSCGVCGRKSLDDLVAEAGSLRPQNAPCAWSSAVLTQLFSTFGGTQPLFAQTGCTHSASLVNTAGQVLVTREDVGRHNAVDKVIGHLALSGQLPASGDQALLVSSRASLEIVHKALVAGFAAVFCLSAPTSLAVDLARQCGILLAGFFRAGGFNIYSEPQRVAGVLP